MIESGFKRAKVNEYNGQYLSHEPTEDALTISEEGAGVLTQQLVLQGLETFTFLIDNK